MISQDELKAKMEAYPRFNMVKSGSGNWVWYCLWAWFSPMESVCNIIEIGTSHGHSTAVLATLCKSRGGKLVTIDTNRNGQRIAHDFLEYLDLLDSVELIAGDSLEVLPDIVKRFKYQGAYIDGYHSYRQASQELRLLAENIDLDSDGFIAMDDVNYVHGNSGGDGGLPKLMAELKECGCAEEQTGQAKIYLTAGQRLAWLERKL